MPWRRRSYEVLPALSVRRSELRRSLRTVTGAWVLGITWMACIGGSRVNIFGRMLGFTDFDFGMLAAVPFIARFGQLIATILIEQTGLRKYQFIQCGVVHRILWLGLSAIPVLLPIPSRWGVWAMLAVIAMSWFAAALSMPAWVTWMGDLIPRRIRGRYLGNRSRISRLVQLPVVIVLSLLLDRLTRSGAPMTAEAQPALLWAICAIFGVGALIGTADILLFRTIRELVPPTAAGLPQPAVDVHPPPSVRPGIAAAAARAGRYFAAAVRQVLIRPLRDRVFRHYVAYGAMATFALAVGGPFFWRVCLETLGFSQFGTDVLFLVMAPLAGVLSSKGWGRLIDRWGRRPTLMLATLCTVVSIMPYFFASRRIPTPAFLADGVNAVSGFLGGLVGRPGWQWITADTPAGAWLVMATMPFFGGTGWTGIMLAQSAITMGFSDGAGRSRHVAAYAVLCSVGGMLGGIMGGEVAQRLGSLQASPVIVGPFVWNNWHATFAVSLAARVSAVALLVGMPDPGSGRFRSMVRFMGLNAYHNFGPMLLYPLRIFGWGRFVRRRSRRDRPDGG